MRAAEAGDGVSLSLHHLSTGVGEMVGGMEGEGLRVAISRCLPRRWGSFRLLPNPAAGARRRANKTYKLRRTLEAVKPAVGRLAYTRPMT